MKKNNKQISDTIRKTINSELENIRTKCEMTDEQEQKILEFIQIIPDNKLVNMFLAEKLAVSSRVNMFIGTDINKLTCQYIFIRCYYELFDKK